MAALDTNVITETELLIAFSDLTDFARYAHGRSSREIFDFMSEYAEFVGELIMAGGGVVVKFMGDAVHLAFPEDAVDSGVLALLRLRQDGDTWLTERGMSSRHIISAHYGPVVCGPFGTRGDKRFDMFGETVNIAASTKSDGLAITPQAFRKLCKETRAHLKKHTPPVT